jgi:hypothetical protein
MGIRFLLAAAAITIAAAATTAPVKADTDVDFGIGFGFGGFFFGPGYDDDWPGPYRYYGPAYRNGFNYRAISCHQAEQAVRWNGFRKVRAIDCGLPTYRFTGWRNSKKYTIRVNGRGAITRVTRK